MTGHGGKRAGAGRKKKGAVASSSVAPVDLRAALAEPAPEAVETVAQAYVGLALEALYKELVAGQSESARVSAAEEILDRGWGKPTVESGGDALLPFFGPQARPAPTSLRLECQRLARLAIATLVKVASGGVSESARVRAARALFARGLGACAPARVPDGEGLRELGKKAEADRRAANPDTASPMGRAMAERTAMLTRH